MATPDEEALIAEHGDRLIQMMEQAHSSALLQIEAIKLRIAHYEKLVILCAGTLALSFTAASAFHTQPTRAFVLPSLLHSWQLLMSAIVLGVVSNWLSVTGVTHFGNYLYDKQIGVRFALLEASLIKLAPDHAKKEREAWDRNSVIFARSARNFSIFNRVAGMVGSLAQFVAFAAFVSLYFFAKAVLAAS